MALMTTAEVLTYIKSSAASGTLLYSQIDALRRGVERAVKKYCKWDIEEPPSRKVTSDAEDRLE